MADQQNRGGKKQGATGQQRGGGASANKRQTGSTASGSTRSQAQKDTGNRKRSSGRG
jgi:hypothetical protein